MVEESIYENKGDEMLDDIKNGAGWASYDYVLNAKHSPLSHKERVRLLIRLAKAGILADEDLMSGKEKSIKQISRKALMSVQDLERKYKGRTNPKMNESVSSKRRDITNLVKSFNNTAWIGVQKVSSGGSRIDFEFKASKFAKEGIQRELDKMFPKAHIVFVNSGNHYKVGIFGKDTNESINEMSKPNFNEFEPVTGKYDFAKLSDMSDMSKRIKISKKEFDTILKKLKSWGVDVFRDDKDDFFTIFSYGDNYNLVKVKVNENITEAKHGYQDGTAGYMKNHKDEYKIAIQMNKKVGKKEVSFYDELEKLEDKVGHPKYMIWLSNSLRGFNVDMYKDPKIKNKSEGEEALYLLSK